MKDSLVGVDSSVGSVAVGYDFVEFPCHDFSWVGVEVATVLFH
jgi:hypothetical protein